jgi:hypothetical protein
MLAERPDDVGVLHVMGRSQLRQHHLREALELFARVIARREHVASLRGAAECLHRLLDELGSLLKAIANVNRPPDRCSIGTSVPTMRVGLLRELLVPDLDVSRFLKRR